MDNSSTEKKEMTVKNFALQLKTETKKSHSAAENTKFVSSFLKGVISKESYKQLYVLWKCEETTSYMTDSAKIYPY